MRTCLLLLSASIGLLFGTVAALGQTSAPMPPPIPAPQDVAYPGGTIELDVDATDTAHGVFRVHERLPIAQAGPMILLFPHWLPGWHTTGGEIEKFAGLAITANGQSVSWRRDPVDVTAFHVDAPAGAQALDLTFQFLSATDASQGPIVASPIGTEVEWNNDILYPAGYYATRIMVEPHLTLPAGWTYASALGSGTAGAAPIQFAAVDLSTLVDSPLDAGRYANRIDLDSQRHQVFLTVFGDRADQIQAKPDQIAAHRRLIQQADRLYGVRHFDHYDFLLTVSDRLQEQGLEHHRSSENGVDTGYFTEWSDRVYDRDLLPHEMTHSWNGKYRRPADLWTPNYNVPMRNSLLWVYEGQTEYWGQVLAARSGLWSKRDALDALALTAATYGARPGRAWRSVEDTTNDPIIANRPPQAWRSYQRSEDYYEEGQLIWLEADTLIRERTHGRKSLDNFARAFLGGRDGQWMPESTYTFDDVVAALNAVMPYDWAGFLHARIDDVRPEPPLEGLTRGGYRLVYTEERGDYLKAFEAERKGANFLFSIGFSLGEDGAVSEVMWDGPAFNAGMTVGDTLVAVNGESYDADQLRRIITEAKTDHAPIELLLKTGSHYRAVAIDYHGGLRYPHLERIPGAHDLLSQILAPH